MKVAVIGAGSWGKNLVNNFAELGVLHAVADGVSENRDWVQSTHPTAEVYEDSDRLFEVGGFDAVAIATPPATHHSIAKKAMELGYDCFVEKPLTLEVHEARDLVRISEETEKVLMVGHLLIYQPAISFIKEFLEAGKLGKIYTLTQRRSKLGRVRHVENVLWSFGVHDIAVLLHLVGESPTQVQGFGHAGITEKIEDDFHLHLSFPSGVKANLHNSWLWPRIERELIITGEKGILVFDELKAKVFIHDKTVAGDLSHQDNGEKLVFEGSSQPLKNELTHFLDCCETREVPISGPRHALNAVKVLDMASRE